MRTVLQKQNQPQKDRLSRRAEAKNAAFAPNHYPPSIHLQRTLGNQAVQRLQAKRAVSSPKDLSEQEADRVAEQVMRMPGGEVSRLSDACGERLQKKCAPCAGGAGSCPKCAGPEKLSMKIETTPDHAPSTAPPIVHEALRSPGFPIDSATRSFMEPRFGHDFSPVRVHTDADANASAESINAVAYTVGRDIVFGSGRYAPQTAEGRRLLAHELTHVVQQNRSSTRSISPMIQRQTREPMDAGVPFPEPRDAGVPGGVPMPPSVASEPAEARPPALRICGPDVTEATRGALRAAEAHFNSLNLAGKRAQCRSLHDLISGLIAWDIVDLYCQNAAWIDVYTDRRACATPGDGRAEPCDEPADSCRHSVRMAGQCVLAGTLNYLMWGQMHRLCHQHAQTPENRNTYTTWNPHPPPLLHVQLGPGEFDRDQMAFYINLYKGWGLVEDPSAPVAMARAAFSSGADADPPVANRAHCTEACPFTNRGPFAWTWRPGHVQSP